MAAYAHFLGKKVSVEYRVGEILLVASAIFSGDCGKSIFLERHLEQSGKRNYFRWEIPYAYIHKIEECAEPEAVVRDLATSAPDPVPSKRAAAAGFSIGTSSLSTIVPLSHRPKPT